jgi:hypothetical protein
MCPNVELDISPFGKPKFGWLKKLKNWKPIPRVLLGVRIGHHIERSRLLLTSATDLIRISPVLLVTYLAAI